jgi:AcrR family transcriptional regulator
MEGMRTRREEYAAATRQALLEAGQELFVEQGFFATSVDQIARRARVTRGAVYHHFTNKTLLFEALFEHVEEENTRAINLASASGTPVERAVAAMNAFLRRSAEPAYQRIVMQEGPVVLGLQRWRELDGKYTLGLLRRHLEGLMEVGYLVPVPLPLLTRVLLAALHEAAGHVAEAGPDGTEEALEAASLLMERLTAGLVN